MTESGFEVASTVPIFRIPKVSLGCMRSQDLACWNTRPHNCGVYSSDWHFYPPLLAALCAYPSVLFNSKNGRYQDHSQKEEVCEEDEPKQAHPLLGPL